MKNKPLRCSDCGKFISYDDLDSGAATHEMACPEPEDWITLCPECNPNYSIERNVFKIVRKFFKGFNPK